MLHLLATCECLRFRPTLPFRASFFPERISFCPVGKRLKMQSFRCVVDALGETMQLLAFEGQKAFPTDRFSFFDSVRWNHKIMASQSSQDIDLRRTIYGILLPNKRCTATRVRMTLYNIAQLWTMNTGDFPVLYLGSVDPFMDCSTLVGRRGWKVPFGHCVAGSFPFRCPTLDPSTRVMIVKRYINRCTGSRRNTGMHFFRFSIVGVFDVFGFHQLYCHLLVSPPNRCWMLEADSVVVLVCVNES